MNIVKNLEKIKSGKPINVELVAVSKTKPVSDLMEAYDAGQRIFGENRIQEMAEKYEQMPKDIKWHSIGHVQRNKVKYMAEFVSLIHAVDSLRLIKEINKQAKSHDRVIDCLLQIKIAKEESKYGLDEAAAADILNSESVQNLKNINIIGLMGMATFTDDEKQIKSEFDYLKSIYDKFKTINPALRVLSMGMSGDYKIAIEAGSNMIRVGSSIFGARN
ncbi:MAG: YggS family pyridoxal phosphate-dependent enzyme [Bacteroidota bacterium]